MNKEFPNWVTADTVLTALVEKEFGPIIEFRGNEVVFSLFRDEVFRAIPEEDLRSAQALYRDFCWYLEVKVGVMRAFERFMLNPMTPEMAQQMKETFEFLNNRHKAERGLTFQETLLGHFGVFPYSRRISSLYN